MFMSSFIKINDTDSNDSAPPTPSINKIKIKNDIYYNCTECSSIIEILSINEENSIIEFQCLNKDNPHEKKIMPLKEYLEKMDKYKQKGMHNDICNIHNKNNKYVSYCFDCKCHLCNECLKSRTHINHNKNNIIEIKPIQEELDIIKEVIKYYNIKLENLKCEKKLKLKH